MINYSCRTCKNFKEDMWCVECNYELRLPDNVVKVVRCKDCKHRQEDVGMGDHRWCDIVNGSRCSDDYCSYGERAEE